MMNKIDNSGQGLAKLGRDEDQYMAHVAQGEMVVPPIISPETRARIEAEMKAVGLSPDEYTVGAGMSINPITGMPEFGWLKKTFKSIKKVAKKVAPVIGPLANFIPGVGPLMAAAIQAGTTKLAGGSWKDALKAGAFSYGAGKLGQGIGGLSKGAGTAGTAGATSGNLFSRIKSGIGSYFNPAEGATGIFGGSIGPSIRGGIGSLFSNLTGGGQQGQMPEMEFDASGNPTGLYIDPVTKETFTFNQLKEAGIIDNSGNIVGSALSNLSQGKTGGFDIKNLFGGGTPGQSRLGLIEDFLKGKPSDPVREGGIGSIFGGGSQQPGGGMFGGGLGAAALAGLLGKAAYDAAKEREGGLAATPAVMMDELGRYQLSKELGTGGTRGEFGLGPAPKALEFAGGGLVPSKDEINLLIDALDGTINFEGEAQKIIMDFEKKYGSDMYKKIRDNVSNRTFYAKSFPSKPGLMDPKFTSSDYYVEGRAIQPLNTIRPAYQNGGIVELDMRDGGESAGPGTGTSDDIPAMLSDGEYVMTAKATRGAGAFNVKKNKSGIELVQGGKPSRKKGVENMRELMDIFEAI